LQKVVDNLFLPDYIVSHAVTQQKKPTDQPKGNKMNTSANLQVNAEWQTQARGSNDAEYQIYLACADNGKGGDITRNGAPLKSYDDWMAS
jgi:hypothetical protein